MKISFSIQAWEEYLLNVLEHSWLQHSQGVSRERFRVILQCKGHYSDNQLSILLCNLIFRKKLELVKNKKLISELERKLKWILCFEDSTPNYFRQHITDLKNKLLNE